MPAVVRLARLQVRLKPHPIGAVAVMLPDDVVGAPAQPDDHPLQGVDLVRGELPHLADPTSRTVAVCQRFLGFQG